MEKIYISKEGMDAFDHAIHVKWHGICFKGRKDKGTHDCELCSLYYNNKDMPKCTGCPIFKYTGYSLCDMTPYYEWRSCFKFGEIKFANTPKKMRAALNFYEWLVELRTQCEVAPYPLSIMTMPIRTTSTSGMSSYTNICPNCGRAL